MRKIHIATVAALLKTQEALNDLLTELETQQDTTDAYNVALLMEARQDWDRISQMAGRYIQHGRKL